MARGTVNKVILLGRLGQDPEMRTTAGGTLITNLNIATSETGKPDDQGNPRNITEWHRVVLFGRTAEVAEQYLNKGSQVYIEGRLRTRKWQDSNGQDRYSTEIVGNEMQFVGARETGASLARANQQAASNGFNQPSRARPPAQSSQPQPGGFDDFDDDIPF